MHMHVYVPPTGNNTVRNACVEEEEGGEEVGGGRGIEYPVRVGRGEGVMLKTGGRGTAGVWLPSEPWPPYPPQLLYVSLAGGRDGNVLIAIKIEEHCL